MNIFLSPTEQTELNFPTSNLSTTITNSIQHTDTDAEIKEKSEDNISSEDNEINDFYIKSKSNKFNKTLSQKKLNRIKIYFIAKSKIVKGKEVNFAVPIRCFDDLGNSVAEISDAFIASIFYVKVENSNVEPYREGRAANRPYLLEHLLQTESPFDVQEEVPLENLILKKKYNVDGIKLDLPDEAPDLNDYSRIRVEMELDENGVMRSFLYLLSEYEYTDSMVDNTFLINSYNYRVDNRQKKNAEGGEEESTFLSRCKEINFKFDSFSIDNIISLIFKNTSASSDKNIIPVFSNLEDAQDLLITVLEEINQPFQLRRNIETSSTNEYYRSLNYLDDSFSLQNRYFFPNPESKIDKIKDLLRTYRLIKPRNLSSSSKDEYYHENKYQTKGPFFVEDEELDGSGSIEAVYVPASQASPYAPKWLWREEDYWRFLNCYFPGEGDAYSWFESRDMNECDKVLLRKSQDVKIISMGLADFLEFWNNPIEKNGEILFMPSSKNLNKKKVPLLSKKSRDRFYDYQQKFRESKEQENENYIYEIKISSN